MKRKMTKRNRQETIRKKIPFGILFWMLLITVSMSMHRMDVYADAELECPMDARYSWGTTLSEVYEVEDLKSRQKRWDYKYDEDNNVLTLKYLYLNLDDSRYDFDSYLYFTDSDQLESVTFDFSTKYTSDDRVDALNTLKVFEDYLERKYGDPFTGLSYYKDGKFEKEVDGLDKKLTDQMKEGKYSAVEMWKGSDGSAAYLTFYIDEGIVWDTYRYKMHFFAPYDMRD